MKALEFLKRNRFNVISWFVTILIVVGIVGGGFWYQGTNTAAALVPEPTAQPEEQQQQPEVPLPDPRSENETANESSSGSITRNIQLKTNIPERPRYTVDKYTVHLLPQFGGNLPDKSIAAQDPFYIGIVEYLFGAGQA